jgi:hypothetical protein
MNGTGARYRQFIREATRPKLPSGLLSFSSGSGRRNDRRFPTPLHTARADGAGHRRRSRAPRRKRHSKLPLQSAARRSFCACADDGQGGHRRCGAILRFGLRSAKPCYLPPDQRPHAPGIIPAASLDTRTSRHSIRARQGPSSSAAPSSSASPGSSSPLRFKDSHWMHQAYAPFGGRLPTLGSMSSSTPRRDS